jgi:hypothetical protein
MLDPEESQPLRTTLRQRRILAVGVGVGVALAIGALGLAGTLSGSAETAEPAETPSPVVTQPPIAEPTPEPGPGTDEPKERMPEFGRIDAEPFRVQSRGRDCVNIRPVPETTFGWDPLVCVPEGYLLWIVGEEQEIDGQRWRQALGHGWILAEHLRAEPSARANPLRHFSSVTVSLPWGHDRVFARVGRSGEGAKLGTFPFGEMGIGAGPPRVSADGKYAVLQIWEGGPPLMVLIRLSDGDVREIKKVNPVHWMPDGRLLVRLLVSCEENCQPGPLAVFDPADGSVTEPWPPLKGYAVVAGWTANGRSVVVVNERSVLRLSLDGTIEVLVPRLPDDDFWELALSPDGNRILAGGVLSELRILDLRDGSLRTFERADQRPPVEGCGCKPGGGGKRAAWLDDETIVYHEANAAAAPFNGLTIGRLADGNRRVIPMLSVEDIAVVGSGLLSVTTGWGWDRLTWVWLLDMASGDAVPVTPGQGPAWHP